MGLALDFDKERAVGVDFDEMRGKVEFLLGKEGTVEFRQGKGVVLHFDKERWVGPDFEKERGRVGFRQGEEKG